MKPVDTNPSRANHVLIGCSFLAATLLVVGSIRVLRGEDPPKSATPAPAAAATPAATTPAPSTPALQKWEYLIGNPDESSMAKAGAEGWELVAVTSNPSFVRAFYKRPLQANTAPTTGAPAKPAK